jgi:hypothetical protein
MTRAAWRTVAVGGWVTTGRPPMILATEQSIRPSHVRCGLIFTPQQTKLSLFLTGLDAALMFQVPSHKAPILSFSL